MLIPEHIRDVLEATVARAAENAVDIPEADRFHDREAYNATKDWINETGTIRSFHEFDLSCVIEAPVDAASPGDLFRPLPASTTSTDSEARAWKRVLDVTMMDGDLWYFAIPYGHAVTGTYEDVHFEHDSNYIQLITMCDVCESTQATTYDEYEVDGSFLAGGLCDKCLNAE